jgi:hypothetical protein
VAWLPNGRSFAYETVGADGRRYGKIVSPARADGSATRALVVLPFRFDVVALRWRP